LNATGFTSLANVNGIHVNLNSGTQQAQNNGNASSDQLSNVENLIGTQNRDVLVGNGEANRLEGGAGNDALSGLGGNDVLNGGDGNDDIFGGAGNDTLDGGAGIDDLSGGAGADKFVLRQVNGNDKDIVKDFTDGTDKILVDNDGTALTVAWKTELNIDVLANGDHVDITLRGTPGEVYMTIENVDVGDITQIDFEII